MNILLYFLEVEEMESWMFDNLEKIWAMKFFCHTLEVWKMEKFKIWRFRENLGKNLEDKISKILFFGTDGKSKDLRDRELKTCQFRENWGKFWRRRQSFT